MSRRPSPSHHHGRTSESRSASRQLILAVTGLAVAIGTVVVVLQSNPNSAPPKSEPMAVNAAPPAASPPAPASAGAPAGVSAAPSFQKLVGRWQRPDGGYVLAIESATSDGALVAGYFNPKSIHVAKSDARTDGDALKVFVELQDVNYPGSTYTLRYDPKTDRMEGIYYQAALNQQYDVLFLRMP